ncbi:hypothetical protein BAUCODRAFT_370575 [Baudoinia panamericana UAMH 10762]|uniref:J domain-containing protein n=1 Tax=Baudoinia panamericana (strain UAMH 10762) TaxID=717646 RepID=M2MTJ6_BAUPA|nr:uncharacterized protein BAUCODRAFT_370575 [Baudoinia panamericana UAMH 10762]EMD00232.1 hypothetical protein BAUCODRAFT_370575 [Baudoinia panamericana UAMH 10762]
MSSPTSAAGASMADLADLIYKHTEESRHLQTQIDQLRLDIANNVPTAGVNALGQLETQGKKMVKDLVRRIEVIENKPSQTATDRQYLQGLNRHLVVCDRQVDQLAELTALMLEARGSVGEGRPSRSELLEPEEGLSPSDKPRMYKEKAPHVYPVAPALANSPEKHVPSKGAQHARQGFTLGSPAEALDTRQKADVADDPKAYEEYRHDFDPDGGDDDEVDEEEPEVNKSVWPICYRIMDVDPATDPYYLADACNKAYRKLSYQHDPKCLPNDVDAPARWAAITKAYETLSDPERKNFYDIHGRTPAELEDFDISRLRIGG